MKFNFIYKITNTITGKIYIGKHSTDNLDDGYLGSGIYIRRSIKKYGTDKFIKEVIEFIDYEVMNEREIFWIKSMDSTNTNIGYNLLPGGEGFTSDIAKSMWLDKNFRENHQMVMNSEIIRNKISEGVKKSWKNQEHRNIKEISNKKPEVIKKKSDAQKKIWSDKNLLELRIRRISPLISSESKNKSKTTRSTKESKERISEAQEKYEYVITSPDDTDYKIQNLFKFCKENGLNFGNMNKVVNGVYYHNKKWKGYIIGKEYLRNCIESNYFYTVCSPDGIFYEKVESLPIFCKENNLNYGSFKTCKRLNKPYKGWVVL